MCYEWARTVGESRKNINWQSFNITWVHFNHCWIYNCFSYEAANAYRISYTNYVYRNSRRNWIVRCSHIQNLITFFPGQWQIFMFSAEKRSTMWAFEFRGSLIYTKISKLYSKLQNLVYLMKVVKPWNSSGPWPAVCISLSDVTAKLHTAKYVTKFWELLAEM